MIQNWFQMSSQMRVKSLKETLFDEQLIASNALNFLLLSPNNKKRQKVVGFEFTTDVIERQTSD